MSSDFSITEFRRRRAGDNPPPPETGQLPLEMPASHESGGPQEYVPQAAPARMASPIPEAVPHNIYAPQVYAPMAQHSQPVMAPVAVQPPVQTQGVVPLPMPMPVPQVSAPMAEDENAQTDKPKKESKSLIAGLLGKLKKDNAAAPQSSAPTGPVEYHAQAASVVQNTLHIAPPQVPGSLTVPLRDSISAKTSTLDKVLTVKEKSGLPTWAAFVLGLMSGVILTFAGLALTAKTVENSLEARFSEISEVVQSAEVEPVVGTTTEGDAIETAALP